MAVSMSQSGLVLQTPSSKLPAWLDGSIDTVTDCYDSECDVIRNADLPAGFGARYDISADFASGIIRQG